MQLIAGSSEDIKRYLQPADTNIATVIDNFLEKQCYKNINRNKKLK